MRRSDRVEAIRLRQHGATYQDILKHVGVAKSTLWRWFKAEGFVETRPQRLTELKRQAQRRGAIVVRERRVQRTQAIIEQAKREVGTLTERDLFMLGIAFYWAEGSKQKPHNVSASVIFSNSDPRAIKIFLTWLQASCLISLNDVTFEIYLHETADARKAQSFWAEQLNLSLRTFQTIRWKRHAIRSRRKNIGDAYHGLVRVRVHRSANLNRRIAGWIEGICQRVGESANGKPSGFGPEYPGSIPGSPANSALGPTQLKDCHS